MRRIQAKIIRKNYSNHDECNFPNVPKREITGKPQGRGSHC